MFVARLCSVGCLGLLLITAAMAQPAQPPAPVGGSAPAGAAAMPQTKTYNVDGFVAGVDADKDGFMSKAEFAAVGLTDRMWTFCDPDGDKKISKAEMAACKLPEAVDMSKDGALTVNEVVAFEKTSLGKERGPGEAKPE